MRYIYIILILVSTVTYAQTKVLNKNLGKLDESNLSTGVVAKLNSNTGGSGRVVVANSYGLVGDGRKDLKGSITSGSNILTVSNGEFTNDMVGNFIAIYGAIGTFTGLDSGDKSLQTTIVSVTNPTTVVIADTAGRTVTDSETWTGTDNIQAFQDMFSELNGTTYTLEFDPGIYFMTTVDYSGGSKITDNYNNVVIQNSDDVHIKLNGAQIAAIPHRQFRSVMFQIVNMQRLTISNGVLHQERTMHNNSPSGPPTGDSINKVIHFHSANYNTVLEQIDLGDCQGTVATTSADLQFTNYIKGVNSLNYNQRSSEMVYGTIDPVTGVKTPDPNSKYAYTTIPLNIHKSQFETTRILNPYRKGRRQYQLSGSSFAGWAGALTARYVAYYYDIDNNFLYTSGVQSLYNLYKYEDNVAYIDIQIERPLDLDIMDLQVRAPLLSTGMTLNNVRIQDAAAHALSNMCNDFTMNGGSIYNIGVVEPAYGSNTEDMRWGTNNQIFNGVRFEDGYGGHINFVGTHNVKVTANTFLGATDRKLIRGIQSYATSFAGARGSMGYYNYYERSSIDLDRGAVWSNNTTNGSDLFIAAGGNSINDNQMWNTRIISNGSETAKRTTSIVRNNTIRYDKSMNGWVIDDPENTLDIENLKLLFNDKTLVTTMVGKDDTFDPFVFGEDSNRLFSAISTPTKDFGGKIKNMEVLGANFSVIMRDYSTASFPIRDIDGLVSDVALGFQKGMVKSRTIKDLKAPWIEVQASDFESTIISETPTLEFININLEVDDRYQWTNTNAALLRSQPKNVNLKLTGGKLNLLKAITNAGSSYNRYFGIKHLGYTLIDGVSLESTTPIHVDFNNTLSVSSSAGDIIIKNCTFKNVTFTLRPQDKILFTYPDANCPVFADNATAVVNMGVGYYYKDSSDSNQFKITY